MIQGLFNLGLKSGGRTLAIHRTSGEKDSVRNESGPDTLRNCVPRFALTRFTLNSLAPR